MWLFRAVGPASKTRKADGKVETRKNLQNKKPPTFNAQGQRADMKLLGSTDGVSSYS